MSCAGHVQSGLAVTGEDLLVIADVHLGPGRDSGGRPERNDDFVDDHALAAFLEHRRRLTSELGRRQRLLLLGDLCDFPHTGIPGATAPGRGRLDTSAPAALAKLDRIATGHATVFEALGRFAAEGNPIAIVPGNHDIELMYPEVRAKLAGLLARAAGCQPLPAIEFHPWIVHVPGLLYAEHGQQRHDINRFWDLLDVLPAGLGVLPPGSQLDELILDLLDTAAPEATRARPWRPALSRAIRRHPRRAFTAVLPVIRFTARLIRSLVEMTAAERPGRRTHRRRQLQSYAGEVGVEPGTLVALERLTAATPWSTAVRIARSGLLAGIARRVSGTPVGDYMLEAARATDALLRRSGEAVPFYVFAHTHVAADKPLDPPNPTPRYLNPGTWSMLVREAAAAGRTFAEIRPGRPGEAPSARVMRWDGAGEAEVISVEGAGSCRHDAGDGFLSRP